METANLSLKSKLPGTGTSIFTTMSKMASDHNAINLSQGFPDFNCSDKLIDLVHFYQNQGYNQYAPTQGVSVLREMISNKIEKNYSKYYNPESEITITAGATQAIYTAITTIVNKGDEVILFEPFYDAYLPDVLINGGVPVFVPLDTPDFSINWNKLEDAFSNKTRLIILNFPHNPTGSIFNVDDLKKLEALVQDKDIFILSDEVYEHIVFDGKQHVSISESELLSNRAFVISSFGKTFHTTGWKVGYCSAPSQLTSEFRKIHQFVVFSVNTPTQYAYADFMKDESYQQSLSNFYEKKRDLLLSQLKISKFKFTPTKSTYFQILNYQEISDLTDFDFASFLTKEIGVAVIPLSPFFSSKFDEKVIRVCFAKNDEVLINAAKKLCDL